VENKIVKPKLAAFIALHDAKVFLENFTHFVKESPAFIDAKVHYNSLSLWLYSPLDLGRFFTFLILYAVGRTP
jgi:hypothetical protein